ncbi:uncharacterized protein PFLUO_LOCUS6862 [Penicillium psychrofluorescens]|uniref:uncharacterized protein n=1 Tax=Penicillium psychrofluorescens TaxID=3158075 RepID=UPI003CCE0055
MKVSAVLAVVACGLAPAAAFRLPLNHGTPSVSLTPSSSPTGPAPSSWSTGSLPIPTGSSSPSPSGGPIPPFPYSSGSSSSSVPTPSGTPTGAARQAGFWRAVQA